MALTRKISAAFTAVILAMVTVACASQASRDAKTSHGPQASPVLEEPHEDPAAEEDENVARWPLTGLTVSVDAAGLDGGLHPPVAVKIDNSRQARPQSGLNAADHVWEIPVEGGITRFLAVYQSQTPTLEVGPIRSMRSSDWSVIEPYGAALVYSGANTPFVNQIATLNIIAISNDAGSAGFSRHPDRPSPHNLYGNVETFSEIAETSGGADLLAGFQEFKQLTDVAEELGNPGDAMASINATLTPTAMHTWKWNAGQDQWLREVDGSPHLDAEAGQLAATNVVYLWADLVASTVGAQVPHVQSVGSGQAMFFTGQTFIEGTWAKSSQDEPFEFADASGQGIEFMPGTTWFHLVNAASGQVAPSSQ